MNENPPPDASGPHAYTPTPAEEDWESAHRLGRRGRILSWILGIGGLLFLAVVAFFLSHQSGSSAGAGQGAGGRRHGGGSGGGRGASLNQPTTVGTVVVTKADLPVTVEALGTVTPAATVTIVPQVSGTITQLLYREGQLVRKGETLAIIDPLPYRAALLQAQGALIRDQAQLENARVLLKRDQILIAQDSIARQDVDTQAALVKQYEGTVAVDRGAVQQAQINLGYTRVVSPVSGRVGLRVVDIGNYIGAGTSTGIAVVTTLQPIDVEFAIPQDQAPAIQKRIAAGAEIPAIALDRTRAQTLDTGRFSTLDNRVDTTTGTIKGKARFANTGFQLYPNQFVNVRLTVDTVSGVVTVPPSAVRSGPNGSFVWLLKSDRTVTQRSVSTGVTTNDQVQIVKGLALGETVITDGGDRLTEGGKVRLPCDKLPPMTPRKSSLWSLFGGNSGSGSGRHRHGQGGKGTGAGKPDCPTQGQGGGSAPATSGGAPQPQAGQTMPAPTPQATARPANVGTETQHPHPMAKAAPVAAGPAAAPVPAPALVSPAASVAEAGACPRPPAGLQPEQRHQWFHEHMAGMSEDQRAACRAQRQRMREQGGGQGG